ncbi:hypothetical protein ACHAXT_002366 [Thalassiosira profunda]
MKKTWQWQLTYLVLVLVLVLIRCCCHSTALAPSIRMVEGHSVHRIASRFRAKLVGRKFAARSPNGRFADGASAIDGRVLSRMEAVGKNLFAFFGGGDGDGEETVVHVHFGMSGAWAVFDTLLEDEPEVKPTTRLRLEEIPGASSKNATRFVTHLSAMTVAHSDMSLYTSKKLSLGEDPLRSDADPHALYERVSKSKKSIGQLIMDQSYFTGPGNIYRAEILCLAGVYPTTPGNALDRPTFDRIWAATVSLLRRGYDTGSILTVDAKLDPEVAARGERRYIYNKSSCARCGGRVSSWDMSGRTCYACEGSCQPKIKAEAKAPSGDSSEKVAAKEKKSKKQVKEGKSQHVPFISHCAPISYRQRLAKGGAKALTVSEIRAVIEQMTGDSSPDALPAKSARKSVHVEALNNLLQQSKGSKSLKGDTSAKAAKPLPPPRVSAEDAAREKATSGENRAVEHVAELSREQAVKAITAVTPSPGASEKPKKKATGKRGGGVAKEKEVDGKRRSSRRKLNYDA